MKNVWLVFDAERDTICGVCGSREIAEKYAALLGTETAVLCYAVINTDDDLKFATHVHEDEP